MHEFLQANHMMNLVSSAKRLAKQCFILLPSTEITASR